MLILPDVVRIAQHVPQGETTTARAFDPVRNGIRRYAPAPALLWALFPRRTPMREFPA